MSVSAAPFHADLAEGPADSRAWWVKTVDGLRIRLAHYPSKDAKGTVLLFPGRTEYVEKYGRVGAELAEAGYDVVAVDWRGQGIADRMLEDPRAGHVNVFEDYQKDVAAMFTAVQAMDLPRPYHLIGHSMGGCIGLRAVMDGIDVATCAFTGPMWGIRMAASARPAAWAISWGSKQVGLSHLFTPGTSPESYVTTAEFDDNTLTTDREHWDYMRRQVLARPELQLGGPSMHWLHEALSEMRGLARRNSPPVPCATFLGSNERIVDPVRIHDRMARWAGGDLMLVDGGEHELLMEGDRLRRPVIEAILALFDTPRPTKAALSA